MTDDQINGYVERFVASCEKIAAALEAIDGNYRRHLERLYPERREYREAVVTRVPNEEDKIRENHGSSGAPISEWLNDLEREEEDAASMGVRERQWLEAQRSSAKGDT